MKDNKTEDLAYSLVKASINSIPGIGNVAAELFQYVVVPPLEKRRVEWMNQVGEKLKELENKINLEEISRNEIFIDVLIKATEEAIKSSEKEKINYFKNAIINTALNENPDISETKIFLKFISDFTIWHIRILKLYDNPNLWFKNNNIPMPSYISASLTEVLTAAFPELQGRSEFYTLIWDDLKRAGLHRSSELQTMMTNSGLMEPRTSDFGKKFLKFIEEKKYSA